jgi:hypothetical protein
MRVKPREKGKVISSRRRLVGLALIQDSVRFGFNQLADGGQLSFLFGRHTASAAD